MVTSATIATISIGLASTYAKGNEAHFTTQGYLWAQVSKTHRQRQFCFNRVTI